MIDNLLIHNITINQYLFFTTALFLVGISGIMTNQKNIINILFSLEIILLSVNLNFIAFSKILGDITGQIFTIFILTVAAAEITIGLAIMVLFFRHKQNISIQFTSELKG